MKPVWQLDGEDIQQLQGNSPRFVRLVNALLFCQAKEGKLPDSCVHLSQTDTERDGGIDGILDRPISEEMIRPGDLRSPHVGSSRRVRLGISSRSGEKEASRLPFGRRSISRPRAN